MANASVTSKPGADIPPSNIPIKTSDKKLNLKTISLFIALVFLWLIGTIAIFGFCLLGAPNIALICLAPVLFAVIGFFALLVCLVKKKCSFFDHKKPDLTPFRRLQLNEDNLGTWEECFKETKTILGEMEWKVVAQDPLYGMSSKRTNPKCPNTTLLTHFVNPDFTIAGGGFPFPWQNEMGSSLMTLTGSYRFSHNRMPEDVSPEQVLDQWRSEFQNKSSIDDTTLIYVSGSHYYENTLDPALPHSFDNLFANTLEESASSSFKEAVATLIPGSQPKILQVKNREQLVLGASKIVCTAPPQIKNQTIPEVYAALYTMFYDGLFALKKVYNRKTHGTIYVMLPSMDIDFVLESQQQVQLPEGFSIDQMMLAAFLKAATAFKETLDPGLNLELRALFNVGLSLFF